MRALAPAACVLAACVLATPAAAQLRAVPDQPPSASAARAGVNVYLINDGDVAVAGEAPARLEVTAADASRIALVPIARAPATIPARGFAKVRYLSAGVIAIDRKALAAAQAAPFSVQSAHAAAVAAPVASPAEVAPQVVAVEPTPTPSVPVAPPQPRETLPPQVAAAPPPPPPPARDEAIVTHSNGESRGFLDRFIPYEPVYGAIGLRSSATKLQFSFGLRPFDGSGALSGLTFAYTQTMFWATDRPSGPFRATTYSPEVFFEAPVAERLTLALGYRHDSNGEADPTSIDVNRVYLRAARSFDLGGGWQAELVPQAWVYVGRRGYTADVKDYLGYTALKASIGQADGIKLAVTARGSVDTGRGAVEAFLSYPLVRLGNAGFYAFAQGFAGYGEALDDYRRRDSALRLGIALTR